ncbi:MAG TPA: maleylpyruvate isomerase family mycothiol-dependent enzyme [Chloroflexota bacterium]|nr:maleylpyruvate isomerase family mycothiol-dependent enzyme [Chloroflexota bacterium]
MAPVDPRRSLTLLASETAVLNRDISALTADQWQAPANCPGWQVADLVAHVVRNGWSFLAFAQRALEGDLTPPFGPSVAHIQEEIKASGAKGAADRQQRETGEFVSLAQGLSDADLQAKSGGHMAGPRPIAWACTQRLVEVAYHHWDLRHSLGQDGPLAGGVATHLLPFMLDPRGSNIMTKPSEGATASSFRLSSGTAGQAWRLTAGPRGRQVDTDAGQPADVEIEAEPGWLALAIYGRVPASNPHLRLTGAADAAARFQAAFGGA